MKIILSLEIEVIDSEHCSMGCTYYDYRECKLFDRLLDEDALTAKYFRCEECMEALISEV